MRFPLLLAERVSLTVRVDYEGAIGDIAQQATLSSQTTVIHADTYTGDVPCGSLLCEWTEWGFEVGGRGCDQGADQAGHGVLAFSRGLELGALLLEPRASN